MKHTILAIFSLLLVVSCKETTSGKRIVPESSGNINSLSVVIDNDLWSGSIGDNIRAIFGAEIWGLPQQEPLFSMRQMPTVVFSDFATKNRIILKVEKGKEADTKFYEDPYARPQRVALVSGKTNAEIIDQLKTNADKIIAVFKDSEIKEKQRRTSKSLNNDTSIKEKLGLTLKFSSAYRFAKQEDSFFWLRRDIKRGNMSGDINLLIYQVPLNTIKESDSTINDIIKMRDSIGKIHIPGPLEGTYMSTEEAYTPFLNKTIIDNKPTFETKSTWEVKEAFLAGPFINYVVRDEINKRLIVLEGFVFAPSTAKRDYIFELESIIRSLKVK